MKPLLSADGAAELTGLGSQTIRTWANEAKRERSDFPCFWAGNHLLIPTDGLIAWLNQAGREHRALPSYTVRTVRR